MLAVWPVLVMANAAAPWSPGDPIGEPIGALQHLAIEREQLVLDLRPVEAGGPAAVTATYTVNNTGPAAEQDLVFVGPGVERGSARVDGTTIDAVAADNVPLPAAWQPPRETPDFSGGRVPYLVEGSIGLRFRAPIGVGRHELTVQYHPRPGWVDDLSMYRAYQLGYVLAPARQWAVFGTLDLEVDAPPGWRVATSLPLAYDRSAWRGSFSGLPDDSFGVTVMRPANSLTGHDNSFPIAGGGLAAAIVLVVAWHLGRTIQMRGWGLAGRLALEIGVACAAALATCLGVTLGDRVYRGLLDSTQLSALWAYGHGYMVLSIALVGSGVAAAAGFLISATALRVPGGRA